MNSRENENSILLSNNDSVFYVLEIIEKDSEQFIKIVDQEGEERELQVQPTYRATTYNHCYYGEPKRKVSDGLPTLMINDRIFAINELPTGEKILIHIQTNANAQTTVRNQERKNSTATLKYGPKKIEGLVTGKGQFCYLKTPSEEVPKGIVYQKDGQQLYFRNPITEEKIFICKNKKRTIQNNLLPSNPKKQHVNPDLPSAYPHTITPRVSSPISVPSILDEPWELPDGDPDEVHLSPGNEEKISLFGDLSSARVESSSSSTPGTTPENVQPENKDIIGFTHNHCPYGKPNEKIKNGLPYWKEGQKKLFTTDPKTGKEIRIQLRCNAIFASKKTLTGMRKKQRVNDDLPAVYPHTIIPQLPLPAPIPSTLHEPLEIPDWNPNEIHLSPGNEEEKPLFNGFSPLLPDVTNDHLHHQLDKSVPDELEISEVRQHSLDRLPTTSEEARTHKETDAVFEIQKKAAAESKINEVKNEERLTKKDEYCVFNCPDQKIPNGLVIRKQKTKLFVTHLGEEKQIQRIDVAKSTVKKKKAITEGRLVTGINGEQYCLYRNPKKVVPNGLPIEKESRKSFVIFEGKRERVHRLFSAQSGVGEKSEEKNEARRRLMTESTLFTTNNSHCIFGYANKKIPSGLPIRKDDGKSFVTFNGKEERIQRLVDVRRKIGIKQKANSDFIPTTDRSLVQSDEKKVQGETDNYYCIYGEPTKKVPKGLTIRKEGRQSFVILPTTGEEVQIQRTFTARASLKRKLEQAKPFTVPECPTPDKDHFGSFTDPDLPGYPTPSENEIPEFLFRDSPARQTVDTTLNPENSSMAENTYTNEFEFSPSPLLNDDGVSNTSALVVNLGLFSPRYNEPTSPSLPTLFPDLDDDFGFEL